MRDVFSRNLDLDKKKGLHEQYNSFRGVNSCFNSQLTDSRHFFPNQLGGKVTQLVTKCMKFCEKHGLTEIIWGESEILRGAVDPPGYVPAHEVALTLKKAMLN